MHYLSGFDYIKEDSFDARKLLKKYPLPPQIKHSTEQ